ncbi:MAG: response regulator [Pseudomonadales bacterium]|nr:response regulator [Pseudomonadales bacterium]
MVPLNQYFSEVILGATKNLAANRRAKLLSAIWLLLILTFAALSPLSSAIADSTTFNLDNEFRSQRIGDAVSVLEDPTNQVSIYDLLENRSKYGFTISDKPVLNYGYTNSSYWITFSLKFETPFKEDWYLKLSDPLMDSADLYAVNQLGEFTLQRAGEDTAHADRLVKSRSPVFKLSGQPGETTTYYLRLSSKDPIQVALTLHSESAYTEDSFTEVLALGAYYGTICVMLFYNLFIYLTTRERSYLAYCLYLGVLIPAQMGFDGLSYLYLWPDSPWWSNRSVVFFSGSVAVFGTYFARVFLNTKTVLPLLDKFLLAHIGLAALVMPIALFAPYAFAATCGVSIAVSFASLMLLTALIGFFRNAPNARFFLFAWLTFTLGLLIRALVATGQIEATLITMYSAQFGTALETVLLSFALADRIKRIEQEKSEAQEQAALALERSNLELQRSNQIKDEFLATISHELRTPMNGIQGMLDLLNTTQIDDKQNEYLGYAQLSTKEMLKHIESILCFSEAQSRRVKLKNAPFQLSQLIYDLATDYENRCKQKFIDFRIHKAANLPNAVEGDAQQLKLVLSNLLDNAVKFTDAGYVELSVACNVDMGKKDRLDMVFQITDSGSGIPKRLKDSLFQPFMQADSSFSRRHGGLGIGLALSKSLAEVLDGDISYQENAPKGSIFTLTLPLRQGDERDAAAFKEPIKRKASVVAEHPSILVVEDNLINQKVISAILKKKNYQVLTALNGEEALKCLDQQAVDLILMDCQMPVMDGFEASRIIRDRKSKYGYPPIIAVTANAMSEDRERCINAGMNDYLAKPVDRYKLYSTIEEWLEYRPMGEQKTA